MNIPPGPWHVYHPGCSEWHISTNDAFLLAKMHLYPFQSAEDIFATATMMAAAPEMYAALCTVVADLEAYCEDHASDRPTDPTVCLPILRAALTLAEEELTR